ncbi:MAG TPA: hypothetical protein VI197_34110 [Polyangiaceae bacterium]
MGAGCTPSRRGTPSDGLSASRRDLAAPATGAPRDPVAAASGSARDEAPPVLSLATPPATPPPASVVLARERVELVLVQALPIDRRDNFQPSGLLWHEGKLLTVSDKHENEVFELVVEAQRVRVQSYRRFALPPGVVELDLEGLCSDGSGGLLLASEAQVRVARLTRDSTLSWATPPLDRLGGSVGLFTVPNAKLEGIARLDDGRIVVAAERSERGLIEVPADGELARALAWNMAASAFDLPTGRTPDFSDLASFENQLFALVRGAHLVVALERALAGWVEREAWSFAATENDDRFGYLDRRYGVAEGLALDGNRVYLVFDNNGNGRTAAPEDVRPQLLVFERPSR